MLDDLHWADEATLAAAPGARRRVCATCRPADRAGARRGAGRHAPAAPPARAAAPGVRARSSCRCGRSTREDTARLAAAVARRGARRRRRRRAARARAGHPVLRRGAGGDARARGPARRGGRLPLPETVLDAVLLRTEALSLDARNALERAAVVGQRFDVEHVGGAGRRARSPRRSPRGSWSRPGPGTSSSGTRSCATRSTRRSRGRAAARCTRRSPARSTEPARRPPSGRRTGSAPATSSEPAPRSARRRPPRRACTPTATRRSSTSARSIWPAARICVRFELLERLAVCAELAGDLAASARAWREAIDGRRGRGEVERVAEAEHAIGRVLALRGSTERALAAWFAAADAFAACGRREDAARSRLAAADVLQGTRQPAARAGRGRGGARRPPGRRAARAALARPLARGRRARASSARPRRRSSRCTTRCRRRSRPVTSRRRPRPTRRSRSCTRTPASSARRAEAYEVAIDYCASTGIAATGYVCSACLCHVLRQRGEWRRSLALCRSLLDDPAADEAVARRSPRAVMSQIHASRGERRPARLRAMEAAPVVRQLRVFGAEMECSWTFARLELLEGSDEAALEHCRDILRRWEESEDRHYSLNALAWSAGVFAACGQEEDLQPRRARAHDHRRRERQPRGARDARPRARRARAHGGRRGRRGRALPARARAAPRDRAAARSRRAARERRGRGERRGTATIRRASGWPTRACRRAGSAPGRCRRRPSARWPSSAARARAPRPPPASRPGSCR